MNEEKIIIASRKSPLALKQTHMAIAALQHHFPGKSFEVLELSTTGDRQQNWSLQKEGGKGLFTKELEEALLDKRAHMAIHSAKDLPTTMPDGLTIAGYLERGNPLDVLVKRQDVDQPKLIATGSPRRQAQIKHLFPNAEFKEIRGRVTTRLEKIANGYADATVIAAAGRERLGIDAHPGLTFEDLGIKYMVPAVGQGAIAIETTLEDASHWAAAFCQDTGYAVQIERAFLNSLGGGCHVAYAAHYFEGSLHIFHENIGIQVVPFENIPESEIEPAILNIINELNIPQHG